MNSVTIYGLIDPKEVRAARSAALKGRVITPEWREKISASKKDIKPTAEVRAKMSLARIGRLHSPETISKMRDAAFRRQVAKKVNHV